MRLRHQVRLWLIGLALLVALGPTWLAAAEQTYGPVRAGESLWEIAGRLNTGFGLTRDQMMLALLKANPDAFSPSCNLNGVLRVGAVLSVPAVKQAEQVDADSARAQVQQQAEQWAEHRRSGRPIACPVAGDEGDLAADGSGADLQSRETISLERGTEAAEAAVSPTEITIPKAGPTAKLGAERSLGPAAAPAGAPELPSNQGIPNEAPSIQAPSTQVAASTAAKETSPTGSTLAPTTTPTPVPAPTPAPTPAPVGTSVHTAALKDSGEGSVAPEGNRAPVWAMTALLLALIAAAMIRWERRWAISGRPFSATTALGAAAKLPKRAVLLLSGGQSELYTLLLLATLAGFFGALVTVLFREGIRLLEWLVSGQDQGLVAAAEALAPWQRLLFPVAGGLLAGLILQQIGGRLRGRSTTDYMEAVAVGDGWISVRHSLVKAGSSLVTVASGGSIGREGAMVQLAAMVASAMGRLSHFPRDRLRLLVAAGAAAGLASAYNAPIAATLFVAEIVLGSIALEHIGPLIIAAVIANTTVHEILGYAPVYQIPAFSLVSDWELALYLVLGILAGHLAPAFLSLLERSHQLFGRLPMPLAGRMALGGLVVGAISVYEPQVWGNGYSVVNAVLQDPWAWQALLTVLVLKMIATAATHGSGAVGGAFTPTIFVGAMLGALFGTLVHGLLPDGTATPSAYAVVGMGAMLAGTTHAPLMSILMVFELTMDYNIVLPLMLSVITAHYTARRYSAIKPMYADSLLPREQSA
ncbi:ClcB-like voltage-gated chloride channel protein [Halochromatium roseum]|uniref:ClcB-like voltage-gated chloride channel protein n=1 Tax=Halochromatium roseum TaxID=391920 RepID=UPI0019143451|nr:ClcB-like voltage-gated chloride channel protein [Halochromatium roseum]MBK5939015.1 fimbrial protein FimV [Halochromatium roseum]